MADSKVTLPDVGLLLVRLGGALLVTHGWDKVAAGAKDPSHWAFVDSVRRLGFPAPALFAWAAALSEFVGGAAVALGIYTRVAAFLAASTMFVAAFMAHAKDGLDKREMALLYLFPMLGLVMLGGGRLTVDSFWRKG